MPNGKSWQNIEDWITEKVKGGAGAFTPGSYKKAVPREEPALDYQKFLEQASRNMIRFKEPEHLIRSIVKTIDRHVKTTHTAMLVRSGENGHFLLVDSKGANGNKLPKGFIKLESNSPLVGFFGYRINYAILDSGVVDYKDLVRILERKEDAELYADMKDLLPPVIREMKLLKANICIPIYYKKNLLGIFILGRKLSNEDFSRQEISFFTTLANDVAMALSNAQLIQDLHEKIDEIQDLYDKEHSMFIQTAISLAAAIDARDPYTHGHTERVTQYAMAMAEELKDLPEAKEYANFKETLHLSALLHDVGKIGIPDDILNKPGKLTKEEFDRVKEHPITGETILRPIGELRDVAAEIRAHHERYDGAGYPDGIKGEGIPFIARIIFVADTYDAITSDRPYRQRKMSEVAVQIIKSELEAQFDPIVVSAFLLAHRKGKLGN